MEKSIFKDLTANAIQLIMCLIFLCNSLRYCTSHVRQLKQYASKLFLSVPRMKVAVMQIAQRWS